MIIKLRDALAALTGGRYLLTPYVVQVGPKGKRLILAHHGHVRRYMFRWAAELSANRQRRADGHMYEIRVRERYSPLRGEGRAAR
jgi:hypothetical protein